jgi:hypothetical protein
VTTTTSLSIDYALETYRLCRFKRFSKEGKPLPCRSPRCPCSACRRKHAEKESAILTRSFKDKPPDYCFTLKIEDDKHTPDGRMASYLKPFVQRFRDYRKANGVEIEYDIRLEFDQYGQPHAHLTVITALNWSKWKMKDMVRGWWSSSCGGRPVKVYCDRVNDATAHARYVTKNLRDRRGVLPPPDEWDSRKCRLNWRSRNFLVRSKKTLWKEQIEEWFPKPTVPVEPPQMADNDIEDTNVVEAPTKPTAAFGPFIWPRTRLPRLRAATGRPVRLGEAFGPVRRRRWRPLPRSP